MPGRGDCRRFSPFPFRIDACLPKLSVGGGGVLGGGPHHFPCLRIRSCFTFLIRKVSGHAQRLAYHSLHCGHGVRGWRSNRGAVSVLAAGSGGHRSHKCLWQPDSPRAHHNASWAERLASGLQKPQLVGRLLGLFHCQCMLANVVEIRMPLPNGLQSKLFREKQSPSGSGKPAGAIDVHPQGGNDAKGDRGRGGNLLSPV